MISCGGAKHRSQNLANSYHVSLASVPRRSHVHIPIVTTDRLGPARPRYLIRLENCPSSERSSFVQGADADPAAESEIEVTARGDVWRHIIDVPPAEAFATLIDEGPGVRVGDMIGPYRIDSPLGAGGMGEVYRARDTNLNRDVAIKILPASFANDPERLARFRREAQVLAALQHPNIAVIYGLEERPIGQHGSAGTAIVMELVDGQTLAERLDGGRGGAARMPLAEALAVGVGFWDHRARCTRTALRDRARADCQPASVD